MWCVVGSRYSRRDNVTIRFLRMELKDLIRPSRIRTQRVDEAARRRAARQQKKAAAPVAAVAEEDCAISSTSSDNTTMIKSVTVKRRRIVLSSDEESLVDVTTIDEDKNLDKKQKAKIIDNVQIVPPRIPRRPRTRSLALFTTEMDNALVDNILEIAILRNNLVYEKIKTRYATLFKNINAGQMRSRIRQIIMQTIINNVSYKKIMQLKNLAEHQGMP
ncbi:hypothetical protein PUN28_000520 [Cardiocondyla obscurior]|uniref:Uncharacterized protein n=1 Tax=Cardiocondyla obscurior TaxID=286306 RepID=A0AAW2GZV8_9HYME